MAKGIPISANAIKNLLSEQGKDVSKITELIKDKAMAGAEYVYVRREDLNVYQYNKLLSLGYIIEEWDDERYKVRGWT